MNLVLLIEIIVLLCFKTGKLHVFYIMITNYDLKHNEVTFTQKLLSSHKDSWPTLDLKGIHARYDKPNMFFSPFSPYLCIVRYNFCDKKIDTKYS